MRFIAIQSQDAASAPMTQMVVVVGVEEGRRTPHPVVKVLSVLLANEAVECLPSFLMIKSSQ
ncbi:MAG: hypothetical protein AB1861_12150 [Cyanobacteriota bacterium]